MMRKKGHEEIEIFQVKLWDVQETRNFFMEKFINSEFLNFFLLNGLSKSIYNVYIKYVSMLWNTYVISVVSIIVLLDNHNNR